MVSPVLTEQTRILIVDQDPHVLAKIEEQFEGDDYQLEYSANLHSALEFSRRYHPQFLLLDLQIAERDGLNLIRSLKQEDPNLAIIVLAAYSEGESVALALQMGAEDFIAKPFDPAVISISMKNILENRRLRAQVSQLKYELERDHVFGMLVGETSQMVSIREFIDQVADTDLNILIRGESGTGKDVTSRLIHQLSSRRDGPFVKVNCAALPENLIESELFGYEKGAFTGAVRSKPGRFQLAHGGTIFLDEISEIPFTLQSKLLQVLEQSEFVRVGGTRNIHVDSRIIAATNLNMEQALKEHRFREDLFFRLNEFAISLPPLRERREDIPLLIDYFLSIYSERYQRPRKSLSPETVQRMLEYPWPGNIRELESLLKRYLVLDSEEVIYQSIGRKGTMEGALGKGQAHPYSTILEHPKINLPSPHGFESPGPHNNTSVEATRAGYKPLSAESDVSEGEYCIVVDDLSEMPFNRGDSGEPVATVGSGDNNKSLREIVDSAVELAEKSAILNTLQKAKWNRRKAAMQLGISYSSLLRRITKYNLETE